MDIIKVVGTLKDIRAQKKGIERDLSSYTNIVKNFNFYKSK